MVPDQKPSQTVLKSFLVETSCIMNEQTGLTHLVDGGLDMWGVFVDAATDGDLIELCLVHNNHAGADHQTSSFTMDLLFIRVRWVYSYWLIVFPSEWCRWSCKFDSSTNHNLIEWMPNTDGSFLFKILILFLPRRRRRWYLGRALLLLRERLSCFFNWIFFLLSFSVRGLWWWSRRR